MGLTPHELRNSRRKNAVSRALRYGYLERSSSCDKCERPDRRVQPFWYEDDDNNLDPVGRVGWVCLSCACYMRRVDLPRMWRWDPLVHVRTQSRKLRTPSADRSGWATRRANGWTPKPKPSGEPGRGPR